VNKKNPDQKKKYLVIEYSDLIEYIEYSDLILIYYEIDTDYYYYYFFQLCTVDLGCKMNKAFLEFTERNRTGEQEKRKRQSETKKGNHFRN